MPMSRRRYLRKSGLQECLAALLARCPEPLPGDHELLRLPNAFVTPHLAGSQGTELTRMAELVLEEIRRFSAGEPPLHPVVGGDLGRIA